MFFYSRPFTFFCCCDRPCTCFFLQQTFHVCFFVTDLSHVFLQQTFHVVVFVTDISHVFLEQTFHIIFFDRPFTFFGGTDFSLFLFATDLSYVGFFDTLFTCVCDRPFFLSFCDRPFTFISFFCDRPFTCFFVVVAAGLPQACPAGCPARASRHHWPGKVPESYTSRVRLWSVLSLSDAVSLMA